MITFASSRITKTETVVGEDRALSGKKRVAFEGELLINRQDFGIAWNKRTKEGSLVVSGRVKIVFNIVAEK